MKKLSAICGLAALMVGAHSAAVNAASTVFTPTDGTVNYFTTTFLPLGAGKIVAIFEDTNTTFAGTNYAEVLNSTYAATVAVFTPAFPNTTVDVKLNVNAPGAPLYSSTLTGNSNFILGFSSDSGANWSAETASAYLGADAYKLTFADGSIIEVDVAVVPVPAAAWLFGTGLVGLIGVARLKQR